MGPGHCILLTLMRDWGISPVGGGWKSWACSVWRGGWDRGVLSDVDKYLKGRLQQRGNWALFGCVCRWDQGHR